MLMTWSIILTATASRKFCLAICNAMCSKFQNSALLEHESIFSRINIVTLNLNRIHCIILIFSKKEFRTAVEKITNLKISDKENDYLFRMVDANKDGVIDVEEELNLEIRNSDFSCKQNGFTNYGLDA